MQELTYESLKGILKEAKRHRVLNGVAAALIVDDDQRESVVTFQCLGSSEPFTQPEGLTDTEADHFEKVQAKMWALIKSRRSSIRNGFVVRQGKLTCLVSFSGGYSDEQDYIAALGGLIAFTKR